MDALQAATKNLVDHFAQFNDDVNDAPSKEPVHAHGDKAMFVSAVDARQFILAGKATITLVSKKTETRFTYRINASKDGGVNFVSLLTGSDNENSYSYFGYIRRGVFFGGGAKAKVSKEAPGAVAFAWAWMRLSKDILPETLEVWHEGRCGRCGRKLTVPSSIASGIGPECASKM